MNAVQRSICSSTISLLAHGMPASPGHSQHSACRQEIIWEPLENIDLEAFLLRTDFAEGLHMEPVCHITRFSKRP